MGKVGSEDQESSCARHPPYVQPSINPVTDIASNDLRCNVGGATGVAGLCEVPVADATTADGSSELFKIVESGYLTTAAGSTWGTEVLNENYERFEVMIPPGLVAGDNLLRAEDIALHAASQPGGAQLYVTCYQIRVSGGGGVAPAGVRFPGAYNESDPGIQVEVWGGGFSEDTIPGPAVVSV
ncbi:glycoside hydrolase family 61 protein [Colletotrichum kahawae]|uniref:lytic cellulose monooxygenase (C4-dehydrogenating) n=1 Tax=Colletotrichum kahawae TaxID=34407 RepID=A0AAD9Y2I8_COLKA|nr:glycoside hydrolase family 61 protein [Colletotrichum kahawae]